MRDAGMYVDVRVEGTPRIVPLGVDLSAYRVVQEALTNSLEHAGGAPAAVTVRYGEHELGIEVTNGRRSPASGRPSEGGYGLAGMRERIGIFGGTLDAGPLEDGGFAVRALLPLAGTT